MILQLENYYRKNEVRPKDLCKHKSLAFHFPKLNGLSRYFSCQIGLHVRRKRGAQLSRLSFCAALNLLANLRPPLCHPHPGFLTWPPAWCDSTPADTWWMHRLVPGNDCPSTGEGAWPDSGWVPIRVPVPFSWQFPAALIAWPLNHLCFD